MQFIAVNLRNLILALHVFSFLNGIETVDLSEILSFLNGTETADLSETFRQSFKNTTDLQQPVTIELKNEEGSDLEFDGMLIADSITALTKQSTFQATKTNQRVQFKLKIPHFTTTGTYNIEGTDGPNKFSERGTFSLELENFTYNDTLPFEDGTLQPRPVNNDEKANYETLHLALANLKFDSEDDTAAAIEDIVKSAKNYLAKDNQLLIETQNLLQKLLMDDEELNKRLSEV